MFVVPKNIQDGISAVKNTANKVSQSLSNVAEKALYTMRKLPLAKIALEAGTSVERYLNFPRGKEIVQNARNNTSQEKVA